MGRVVADHRAAPPASTANGSAFDVVEEIERIIDSPLAQLVADPEVQALAGELGRQAVTAPAMVRLREVVAFVGRGRRATQAGNLTTVDAIALADWLGVDEERGQVRSMADLPEVAHAVRWALAAALIERRGTKVVAGARARDVEHDPLSAWLAATTTLLEHGLLDGFQQGWRKTYVELLDASAPGLLTAMAEAGGRVSLASIQESGWQQVAEAYGYEPDDDNERRHVTRLIDGMIARLADLGAVVLQAGEVALTELGATLGAFVAFVVDGDLGPD